MEHPRARTVACMPVHPLHLEAMTRPSPRPRASIDSRALFASWAFSLRRRRSPKPTPQRDLTIRLAGPSDRALLRRLAELDSAPVPAPGPALIAESGGEPIAALSIADGRVVADPFRRTAAAVEALHVRADSLAARYDRIRERRGLEPRPASAAA